MNQLLAPNVMEHNFDFSQITAKELTEAFETYLGQAEKEHETIVNEAQLTYEALFGSNTESKMNLIYCIAYHYSSVLSSDENRTAFENIEQKAQEFYSKKALDDRLYHKICAYTNTEDFQSQEEIIKKAVFDIIRKFEDCGIHLPEDIKAQITANDLEISKVSNEFSENLIKAKKENQVIFSIEDLPDLPERFYKSFESCDIDREEDGKIYRVIPQSMGLYSDIMTYCSNELARKAVYEESLKVGVTEPYDNRKLLKQISDLKQKGAALMGYETYSHQSMKDSMAKNAENATAFIDNIAQKALPFYIREQETLIAYGKKLLGRELNAWDMSYVTEKYSQEHYQYEQEEVRNYFTVNSLMKGFFEIFETLYKIKFEPITNEKLWNEDAIAFNVLDMNGNKTGKIYFDLYMRSEKRGGAWMMNIVDRDFDKITKKLQLPVTYITCNAPKSPNGVSTLSYYEVNTFFHEMGHGLHQLLTKVDFSYFSGLNQVQRDSIELPSQFMENFCYDYEVIKKISAHKDTGEPLPKELFDKMMASKNFNQGTMLIRQCIMSKTDMTLYSTPGLEPCEVEEKVIEEYQGNRFFKRNLVSPTFSHIFDGGYSANYYSYLWAEVLSADAFAALKESGDTYLEQIEAANKFKECILEVGGVDDMASNFRAFRGRDPEVKYLLESYGLVEENLA